MVTIAASRVWAVSTLRWHSRMSHLLIVDAHLGVAGQAPLPRQRGRALLPPSLSSSRPGCRQSRSTSGVSTGGLRITVVANPPGNQPPRDHCSSCAPQPVELPMECAGPSTMSIPAVSLALLSMTGCRLLHRRVSQSFWRRRFVCAAAPAVAMPEWDLEITAMLSRAAERVGLEWRPPPCPKPSRLGEWFLGVAFAGSQRPTRLPLSQRCMGSLQVGDGIFYCQKQTC